MRKLSARVAFGSVSPMAAGPPRIVDSRGNVRVGLALEFHERKNGGLVVEPGAPAAPRSNSSQL